MRQLSFPNKFLQLFPQIGVIGVSAIVGFLSAKENFLGLLPLIVVIFGGYIFLHPQFGLSAFCYTLILTRFDWYAAGGKLASPNSLIVGCVLLSWLAMVLRQGRSYVSTLYWPVGFAALIAWLNFIRYGESFFHFPYVFSQALLLFLLSYHLIQDHRHVYQLLAALISASIIRNSIDLGQTVVAILSGNVLSSARYDLLWLGGTVTTESEWRILLLPLFAMISLLVPSRPLRFASSLALLLDMVWLMLAGTRTGMIGLLLVACATLLFLPPLKRKRLLSLLPPFGLLGVFLMASFSETWSHIVLKTQIDLEGGWELGRMHAWRTGFYAFLSNPWWGSSLGLSHSFFLWTGRTMGLVFLVPFSLALWMIWRRSAWLREQSLDPINQALVAGLQAGLLVAVPLNFTGTMLMTATSSMFFWLLVGMQEALYLDIRSQRHFIEPSEIGSNDSNQLRQGQDLGRGRALS